LPGFVLTHVDFWCNCRQVGGLEITAMPALVFGRSGGAGHVGC